MNVEKRAERAVETKKRLGYNCAQAVASALADQTGIPEPELVKLTAGFGAGMGTTEATCGALIGAGVVAGLATDGSGSVGYARRILGRFKTMCGATACKELKTVTNGKPLCPCDDCVRNAVTAYIEVVGLRDGTKQS